MNRLVTEAERNSCNSWEHAATLIDTRITVSQVPMPGLSTDNFLGIFKPIPVDTEEIDAFCNFIRSSPTISDEDMIDVLGLVPSAPGNASVPQNETHFYIRSLQLNVRKATRIIREYEYQYVDAEFTTNFQERYLEGRNSDDLVWIRYCGQTRATTPNGRLLQDIQAGRCARSGVIATRFINFYRILEQDQTNSEFLCYEVPSLLFQGDDQH
jgi:hypothetical protein